MNTPVPKLTATEERLWSEMYVAEYQRKIREAPTTGIALCQVAAEQRANEAVLALRRRAGMCLSCRSTNLHDAGLCYECRILNATAAR